MITKGKPDKLDFFVINKFSSIGINKKMNSQFRGWENIVLKHKLDKKFVSRCYRKHLQLKKRKQKQTARKRK